VAASTLVALDLFAKQSFSVPSKLLVIRALDITMSSLALLVFWIVVEAFCSFSALVLARLEPFLELAALLLGSRKFWQMREFLWSFLLTLIYVPIIRPRWLAGHLLLMEPGGGV
jgi:hypothetical protein